MNRMRLWVGSGLAITLAACATAPEPEPILTEPEVVERAPEVIQEPEVIAPPAPVQEVLPPVVSNPVIAGSSQDFAISSGGEPRVFFAYDQFTLSPEARSALMRQANWLLNYSNMNAIIEGHADERGTREYNLALGARRAEAVKSFLVSQGVAPSRLTTVSYGKERPIDARSNEEGWARNRNGFTNLTTGGFS